VAQRSHILVMIILEGWFQTNARKRPSVACSALLKGEGGWKHGTPGICLRDRWTAPRHSSSWSRPPCGILIPLSHLVLPGGLDLPGATLLVARWGKYVCYAMFSRSHRPDLGILADLSLGNGRSSRSAVRDGNVPDAPDRHRGGLRKSCLPDFHGVPELPKLPWYWYG